MPAGRPSDFTQEIADMICNKIIEGQSLRAICREDESLSAAKVCRWLGQNEKFREQYAHAREAQADTLFDETLDIADQYDSAKDAIDTEHIQRAKLRIDTRKWVAGKLRPKKYGEKVQAEITGDLTHSHKRIEELSDEELAAIATGRSNGTSETAKG